MLDLLSLLQVVKKALGLSNRDQADRPDYYSLQKDPTNGGYDIQEHSYDPVVPDYESMTKAELLKRAKILGVKVSPKSKKKDIVKELEANS